MSRPITATVRLTVKFDPEAWNAEYGDEESPADITEALRMMALDSMVAATRHLVGGGAVLAVDRQDWA